MTATDTPPTPVNLRDVAGLRTDEGRTVAAGVLYRSEAPQPGDAAPADVASWPVRTVVDLRSHKEADDAHPLAGAGARVHHFPLGLTLTPDAKLRRGPVDDLAPLYLGLVRGCAAQIADAVTAVADGPGPALVHCVAGKDRTGIIVGILLRAVGVRRGDVLADYVRTRERLPLLWPRLTRTGTRLPDNPVLLDVDPRALTGVLDHVDDHHAGAAGWLVDAGVTAATLAGLRARLLPGSAE